MTTTTLITFRVRAPRSTRTLELYGSWDNFSTPYPMSRDLQIGSEYWSGCFNFSNIICDGRPGDVMRSRDGGLKMGGTYWYFYKINDDIDFHNVCERATTNCPMMPGQLINVLHVPYAFCGSRSRNPSTSSTNSEQRTMNPQDRFMNPRPAPAKPEVLRVKTSPTLDNFPDDKLNQPTTDVLSSTPNNSKLFRLAKKASLDSLSTTSAKAGGLRAAFKIRTARSQSPDEMKRSRGHQDHQRATSTERKEEDDEATEHLVPRPQRGLLLRSCSDETVPTLSFERHRQQRSRSREISPLVQRKTVETLRTNLAFPNTMYNPLTTVTEIASAGNTPNPDDVSETENKPEPNLEKRLPTLPNTPSSAYPASVMDKSPEHGLDLDYLDSHFSATTIDTTPYVLSQCVNERSHFSAWTTTTDTSSIFIDNSVPLPVLKPIEFVTSAEEEKPDSNTYLRSSISYTSMSSSISTTPSTSFIDTDVEFEAAALSADLGLIHKVPHYSLPEDDYASTVTLKAQSEDPIRGRTGNPAFYQQDNMNPPSQEIVHSESMRRLLDELSYLSGMIQN